MVTVSSEINYIVDGVVLENGRVSSELNTFNWEELAYQVNRGNKAFRLVCMSYYVGLDKDYVIESIDISKREIVFRTVDPVASYDQSEFIKNL